MKPRLEICFSFSQQTAFLFGQKYTPTESEFLLNHARSGILLALNAMGLPQGTGVGVMVYNCHTVMNAVEQAGCKPVFLDVTDELTLDLDDLRKKSGQIEALIVTHLFGIVNNVKAIKAEFPELLIVEDCAHAYGIDKLYGDFAIFSIGQGKLPSIGDGGILKVLNDRFKGSVEKLFGGLTDYSKLQSSMLFLKLWAKSLLYSHLIYGWLSLPVKNKRSVASGKEAIALKKMCRGISAVYAIEKDQAVEKIVRRKQRATEVLEAIRPFGISTFYLGCNAFMLVVSCESPAKLQKELAKQGVDSATHFANAIHWATEFGYASGQCPNAEKIIKHLLMIPIY